ncbi:MAG: hypothetical protein WCK89_22285, partial [bacterium]
MPELTLVFWIIKIMATTLGETGGDRPAAGTSSGSATRCGDHDRRTSFASAHPAACRASGSAPGSNGGQPLQVAVRNFRDPVPGPAFGPADGDMASDDDHIENCWGLQLFWQPPSSFHISRVRLYNTGMTETLANEVTCRSSPEEKIALFGALFRGREDVYPRRFESATSGRAGYQPACANEWVRGVCAKPKTRCALCGQRKFMPVTMETVRWHLSGEDDKGRPFVMGVYPLLTDEHCRFVAADFDKAAWREDVRAVVRICGDLGLPVAVERSRSGNGAHLWWFFAEPLSGRLAREFASWILTETLERRPEVGLDSYDRLFPSQDTIPKGGFGNLIALPLQKQARALGNSVFVDAHFEPFGDQWAFLRGIRRLYRDEVEKRVESARRDRRIVAAFPVAEDDENAASPWEAPPSRQTAERPLSGPLPEQVEVVLGDQVYLRKAGLTPALTGRLLRLAAFQNPEFYKAQAMRRNTFGTPRVICCAEDTPDFWALPRGCLEAACALLHENGIRPVVHDERVRGTPLDVSFHGELRPEQERAAKAMLASIRLRSRWCFN